MDGQKPELGWTEEENNRFAKLYEEYKNKSNLKEILRKKFLNKSQIQIENKIQKYKKTIRIRNSGPLVKSKPLTENERIIAVETSKKLKQMLSEAHKSLINNQSFSNQLVFLIK